MLNVVYAGSPDISALPLTELVKSGICHVVAVLTNPPSPQGRSKALVPTPVALAASEISTTVASAADIAILTPQKLDEALRNQIAALKPDLLVCFAYGKIFGPKFLSLFPMGGINLHPSLLPRHRGCAPVPAAILAQDKQTGITIQRIGLEMDAGNILLQEVIELTGKETSESLLSDVSARGGKLLAKVINTLDKAKEKDCPVDEIIQDGSKATYCTMLQKSDGQIDWRENATSIDAKIRAFYPWPGAFTTSNGVTLRLHASSVYNTDDVGKEPGLVLGSDKKNGILIQTGKGVIAVSNLQWQAKKAMNWKDFLNGSHNFIGTILEGTLNENSF